VGVKTLNANEQGVSAKIEDLNVAIELTNTWLSVSGDTDPEDAAAFLETLAKKISDLRAKAMRTGEGKE
jgi:hypothetical protein